MDNNNLKQIKKAYGEKMSYLCRDLFPMLLETDSLFHLLFNSFHPSRSLYDDLLQENKINDFKNYIMSLTSNIKDNKTTTIKTPQELMLKAEYTLYEIKNTEELSNFKQYYTKDELLCTFKDGENGIDRLKNYHVFFAIKNNIENIKRSDNPRREDDYGVSCISIQIQKNNNWLSIKNRYNHTVNNPDATFSNNLDNIIEGLTEAFNTYYNLKINKAQKNTFELQNYVKINNKYYKCNMEINNIYYCSDNIIINNGNVKQYDKSQYKVIDYFILDKKNKTLEIFDKNIEDTFVNIHNNFNKITEIDSSIIFDNNIVITLENNNIVEYKNTSVTSIGNDFLYYNKELKSIELPSVTSIGNSFLCYNRELKNIELPSVTSIGNDFLYCNKELKEHRATKRYKHR